VDDPAYLNREQHFADAGVYRLTDELALVQTVDFFTPVVDDPYKFGQIAAANSFSDVYAMGGKPLTALNLICFPSSKQPLSIMEEILKGGFDKIREAGAALIGGHSIEDPEPKYGLAVTGVIDPRKMITGTGARPGDRLVLTKPLGTGVITTALKGEIFTAEEAAEAIDGMAALNAAAGEAMIEQGASACTDITGFGLLGHLNELLISSNLSARLDSSAVPFYPGALEAAAQGLIPGGAYRNLDYYRDKVKWEGDPEAGEDFMILFADPQTSGGLLIAIPPERLEALLSSLEQSGVTARAIGAIEQGPAGTMIII
jgi:selenide, water dikinase